MKKIITLLALSLLYTACSKKEEVTPIPGKQIFKLVIDPAFSSAYSADWLIIHDTKGHLLFSKLFESSDTVLFNSNNQIDGDKINITLLQYTTPYTPGVTFDLVSYLQIPFGEEWTLKKPVDNGVGYLDMGAFNIVATNIPLNTTFTLSDKVGNGNPFTYIQSLPYAYESSNYRLYPSPSFLLTTRDPQDNLRYKFIDNVKPGDQDTISYLDMSIPETTMQVSFPKSDLIFLNVEGFEQDQSRSDIGYRVHNYYDDQGFRTKINIGYPDRLDYYHTRLGVRNSNGDYVYDKLGTKSTAIAHPFEAVFALTNPSVQNFSFTANTTFNRRQSNWSFNNNSGPTDFTVIINWVINGPADGEQKIGPFPASFSSIYPDLKIDRLTHISTTFFLNGALSYSDLLDSAFKGKDLPAEHETYSVIVE